MYHDVIHGRTVDAQHRKERWLHTRISEALADALQREARRRRLPVSLLVRNVLEGALDLVEDMVETRLAATATPRRGRHDGRGSRPAPRDPSYDPRRAVYAHARAARAGNVSGDGLDDVYGWQELIIHRAAACGRCKASLAAGTRTFRGLREHDGPPVFLCAACVARLGRSAAEPHGGS
jgi:hypothetical protein